jgi:hypothetical protein
MSAVDKFWFLNFLVDPFRPLFGPAAAGAHTRDRGGGGRRGAMSRFGMGFGKDNSAHTHNYRPCVRVHSSRCQQVLNKWFGTKDDKRHPDWMTTEFTSPPREALRDQGEWQLVWHPRSRPNTVTVPTRKVLVTLKDEDEKVKLKARLAAELSNTDFAALKQASVARESARSKDGERDAQGPERDDLASQASHRSRLTSGNGSQRALSTAGSILKSERARTRPASTLSGVREDDMDQLVDERMGTACSRASRMSKASRRSRSSLVCCPIRVLWFGSHAARVAAPWPSDKCNHVAASCVLPPYRAHLAPSQETAMSCCPGSRALRMPFCRFVLCPPCLRVIIAHASDRALTRSFPCR